MGIGKRHSGSGIRGSVLLPNRWRRDPPESNALQGGDVHHGFFPALISAHNELKFDRHWGRLLRLAWAQDGRQKVCYRREPFTPSFSRLSWVRPRSQVLSV